VTKNGTLPYLTLWEVSFGSSDILFQKNVYFSYYTIWTDQFYFSYQFSIVQ